jgi:hypothetical protein
MHEVYRVSDVDEAVDLASQFREEKRYDWFRGQTRSEWLPHTSLMRLQMRDPAGWESIHKPQFVRFYHWLKTTPGLKKRTTTASSTISAPARSRYTHQENYGVSWNIISALAPLRPPAAHDDQHDATAQGERAQDGR